MTSKKYPAGAVRSRSSWNEVGARKPRCTTMPLPCPVRPWQGEQNTLKRSRPRAITSAVTGIGKHVRELAVDLAGVEMLVLAQRPAGDGVGHQRARAAPVAKERARLERLVPRRVVHILPARRRRQTQDDGGELPTPK